LLNSSSSYTKPPNTYNQPKPLATPQTLPAQQTKTIPLKPKEPIKCWGCQEPWTPEHTIVYKFRRVVHEMPLSPEDWLDVERVMEEENHILLQAEVTETETNPQPQLLMISAHDTKGISPPATFSVIVSVGRGKPLH
jgi:hypothetical protein